MFEVSTYKLRVNTFTVFDGLLWVVSTLGNT